MQWHVLSPDTPHTLPELFDILLRNRKIKDADIFFHPPNPNMLSVAEVGIAETTMQRAVARITTAIKNKEKMVVFGDYDADGICATTILWQTLVACKADVLPFLPNRQDHG